MVAVAVHPVLINKYQNRATGDSILIAGHVPGTRITGIITSPRSSKGSRPDQTINS